jgi:hypothetical protein
MQVAASQPRRTLGDPAEARGYDQGRTLLCVSPSRTTRTTTAESPALLQRHWDHIVKLPGTHELD